VKLSTPIVLFTLMVVALAPATLNADAPSPPPPIFGPAHYEITAPPQQVFADSVNVASPGLYLVSVINGDVAPGGDHRVTSGTLLLQGHPVFPPGEINNTVKHLERRIFLDAIPTPMIVILNGPAGSFVTVTVVPVPIPPVHAGKIVLDFGSREGGSHLALFLHNNNFVYDRAVRLIFLDMLGQPAGVSDLLTIPPSGTLPVNPDSVPAPQPITWQQGSIDIIWTGPGATAVTGYAEQVDPAGRKTIVPLHNLFVPPQPGDID
jgi:hypothetical protein